MARNIFNSASTLSTTGAPAAALAVAPAAEVDTALKVRIHQRLLELLNLSLLDKTPRGTLRGEIRGTIGQLLTEERRFLTPSQTDQLIEDVLDELLGLGPLEPLLKDDTIADILINTHTTVYVERRGKLELTDVHFQDTRHLVRIINKIVAAVGRRVDESTPMVDARLADGSRVNAIIPPVAVDGPLVSIRKFAATPIHMLKLVEYGSITTEMAQVLSAVVNGRRNILVSGGTGSGKTTLLNALSAFIDHRERIVTIEDSAELQLQQPHVGRMETRPANTEGTGEVSQRDLLKNSLRMRPDRIIVGEVRSGEAFDMLQAMNTGHDGSMTTVHANTPRDALSRLEQMIGMAGLDIAPRSIRQQIASAIHVVVQTERSEDGRRRVMSIAEITGMEGDVISMQEIFRFRRRSRSSTGMLEGDYEATGVRPKFMELLTARGINSAGVDVRAGSGIELAMASALTPILYVLVFVGVVFGAQMIGSAVFANRDRNHRVNRRLTMLAAGVAPAEVYSRLIRKAAPKSRGAILVRLYEQFDSFCGQAGLDITPPRLLLYTLGGAGALWLISIFVLSATKVGSLLTNGMVAMVGSFVLSGTIVYTWVNRRRTKRLAKIEEQLPLALDVVNRAIRAGHPVTSAMQLAADEMGDPLGTEFGLIVDETTYGAEFRSALTNFARRTGSADAHFFAVSIGIQAETGGNLAEILEGLANVIRARATLAKRVVALASEGKASATLLSVLPLILIGFMMTFRPTFYTSKFNDPVFWPIASGIVGLYLIGQVMISRIINFKY